jgi:hypothetical protein
MNVAEGETVYFLDTSALAKLYHQEQGSEMVEGWAADHTIRLWLSDLARIELHSVLSPSREAACGSNAPDGLGVFP